MEKCEWEDRKYVPCKSAYNHYLDLGKPYGPFWNQEKQIFIDVSFCPWCGADIRKPEEPIIKKSGKTWVALFDGIDYLCVDPISCNGKSRSLEMEFEKMPQIWERISGIEITDDIAKLRPKVIDAEELIPEKASRLIYVHDGIAHTDYGTYGDLEDYRLATVKDLK